MSTYGVFRGAARELAQDTTVEYLVSDDLLLIFANYGIKWISSRHPSLRYATLPLVDAVVTVPSDHIHTMAIYADGQNLVQAHIQHDGPYPLTGHYVKISDAEVAVSATITETSVEVYYLGNRDRIAGTTPSTEQIPVPENLEEALLYYVAGRMMMVRASRAATLDQYDMRIDSGKPTDNPLLQMAAAYHKTAQDILALYAQN